MPVKHALLALLAERDCTGYELKVRFERTLGDGWQLNSGQVYSTLERLRRAGLVRRQRDPMPAAGIARPEGARATRRRVERAHYTLLPRGRRELERWLATPVRHLRAVRDPLHVRLVFSPPERLPALLTAFGAERRRYAEALAAVTALVAHRPLSHTARTRWLVAEAARLAYAAQLAWLEQVERLLTSRTGRRDPLPARTASRLPARPAVSH